jgi:hypothetical protein
VASTTQEPAETPAAEAATTEEATAALAEETPSAPAQETAPITTPVPPAPPAPDAVSSYENIPAPTSEANTSENKEQ